MSLYKAPPHNGKPSASDVNDPFNWPPSQKKKIIIASVVGGSTLLITGIILTALVAGMLALGTLGLIADSPSVIEDSRRTIYPDYGDPIDPDQGDPIDPDQGDPIDPDQGVYYTAYDNSLAYPSPGNQGSQGSCTAWATAYALKSAQDKIDHGWDYSVQPAFSPAYVYNQINYGQDGGSLISEAMRLITEQGACILSDMPYNDKDYITQPNNTQIGNALPHKAKDWFSVLGVEQIKIAIVNYGGVVVGINVHSDFDELDEKNPIYDIQSGNNRGGHAVCLVGYDDEKNAFKLINSWGTEWGLEGFGWVSYDIIEADTKTYGAFSMTDEEESSNIGKS